MPDVKASATSKSLIVYVLPARSNISGLTSLEQLSKTLINGTFVYCAEFKKSMRRSCRIDLSEFMSFAT